MTYAFDNSLADSTHFSIVLDRTGSMQVIRQDTIDGFNSFLNEQKSQPNSATFTLVQFDSLQPFQVVHEFTDIRLVPALTLETYVPRGYTPLYDAVGRSITHLKARLLSLPEELRPSQIVVVIVTDGMENTSRQFTGSQVRQMVAEARASGWHFVFLSADESEITDGKSLHVAPSNAAAFSKNKAGAKDMWSRLSNRSAVYRAKAAPSMRMDQPEDDAKGVAKLKSAEAAARAAQQPQNPRGA